MLKRRTITRACISGPRPPDYRLQGLEVVLQGLGTLFGWELHTIVPKSGNY